jgi:uncharacterized protein YhaN
LLKVNVINRLLMAFCYPVDMDTQTTAREAQTTQQADGASETQAPVTFDAWLAGQDETVKALAEQHTAGLRSALQSEREQRKEAIKQLKELATNAEKGSELEGQLQKLLAEKDAAERRATFLEAAQATNCTNPKAAFLIAQTENLFKRDGTPDWEAIQTFAPEFFRPKAQTVSAGIGTQGAPPTGKNMNDFIRRAAGRG